VSNRVDLSGCLVEKKAKRYTPAGLPVLELTLGHESPVIEAASPRVVTFEIRVKAIGQVAERIETISIGTNIKATGFLAPFRQHSKQLIFHLTDFELE
jgi:primosomal replication protein N